MTSIMELKEISSSYSLLYVEDDKELAQTFITYFSKIFNEVIYAQNGLEGLELFKDNNFELVITDIKMPEMSGLEMSKKIKEIDNEQNIIVISAYSDTDYFIESIKLGIDAYVTKPVNYTDLNNVLFKIVKRIQIERENGINSKELLKTIKQISRKNEELSSYIDILNKVAIVSRTNVKGHITYVNDLFCEISGYSQEELLGVNHNVVRHPDMAQSIFKELWETIQEGNIWEGSIKNKSKSGESYFVYATIIPIYNEDHTNIKEYIGIRFLTTKEENAKRNFQKNVISRYQEFKKKDFNTNKKIQNLEEELIHTNDDERNLRIFIEELREKNKKLLGQISFYEKEFDTTNDNHQKTIDTVGENLKKITQDYKKLLIAYESQKKEITFFNKNDKLREKEIVKLHEKLNEQSLIVHGLRDTIKHINDEKKNNSKEKKHFWE